MLAKLRLITRLTGRSPWTTTSTHIRRCSTQSNDKDSSDWIETEIESNPELAKYGKELISNTQSIFNQYGFSQENIQKILHSYPDVCRIPQTQLNQRLGFWRACQFNHSDYYALFVQCPEILQFADEQDVGNRIADLKSFARTPKNVWRLLMVSPNVLTDRMDTINEKLDYMIYNMQAELTDVLKSGAFSHPLNKIQCRHMLMVRLGLYKPKRKKSTPLDSDKNPRLYRIFDSSNKEFAQKLCGISLEELAVFNKLYTRELEEAHSDDDYNSEEEDDEEDNEMNFDAREKKEYNPKNLLAYKKKGHLKKKKKQPKH